MTDEQINIAIAEACGIAGEDKWGSLYHTDRGYVRDCPDFCKDLNAMHEAEKSYIMIGPYYYEILQSIIFRDKKMINPNPQIFSALLTHATARQRAEAFLRTLNLWKE